jgi:hypothetical protein
MCYSCSIKSLPYNSNDIHITYVIDQMLKSNPEEIISSFDDPYWSYLRKQKFTDIKKHLEHLFEQPSYPGLNQINLSQFTLLLNTFVFVVASHIKDSFLPQVIELFSKNVNPAIFPLQYDKYGETCPVVYESLILFFKSNKRSSYQYAKGVVYEDLYRTSFETPNYEYDFKENILESPEEIPYYLMCHLFCRHIGVLLREDNFLGMTVNEIFSSPFFSYFLDQVYLDNPNHSYAKKKWLCAMIRGGIRQFNKANGYSIEKLVDSAELNPNFLKLVLIVSDEHPEIMNYLNKKQTETLSQKEPKILKIDQ